MGRAKAVVLVILGLLRGNFAKIEDPIVYTDLGFIRGRPAPDGDYSMFLGIPYANVNISNPFGVASPHPGFEFTYDAFDDSIVCPQREEMYHTLVGTLDCLRINVYVPKSAGPEKLLPVMVDIYGGGFIRGFDARFQYDPRFLVSHDVIVVNFNYRVGSYGFLCLDTPEVPGNQGLKDQLLALRWIKNNIAAFGGDINKITLSGQSAGAISVDLHLIYNHEDLFQKAIMESGNSLQPFAIVNSNPDAALELAERLGYKAENTEVALQYLSTLEPQYIVQATENFLRLAPCVEKKFDGVERFVTEHPTLAPVPEARNVPVLIGVNSNELGLMYDEDKPEDYKRLSVFTQLKDYFYFDNEYGAKMVDNVHRFYIGDEVISEKVKDQITDFASDFNFYHPTHRTINKYIRNGESTLYYYVFSFDGDRNYEKVKYNVTQIPGAIHADELGYLFDMGIFQQPPSAEDQLMIDRMTTMWTNFIKYSDPTPEVTELLPVKWPKIQDGIMHCLNIDSKLTVEVSPFYDRLAYWDLFYRLNWRFMKNYPETP